MLQLSVAEIMRSYRRLGSTVATVLESPLTVIPYYRSRKLPPACKQSIKLSLMRHKHVLLLGMAAEYSMKVEGDWMYVGDLLSLPTPGYYRYVAEFKTGDNQMPLRHPQVSLEARLKLPLWSARVCL